jgi:hypothetical protein
MSNLQMQKSGALDSDFFHQHLPASDLERWMKWDSGILSHCWWA